MQRKIYVTKKTGFTIKDPMTPVNIRDYRGVAFYSTESMLPGVTEFNLPPGEYLVDSGNFKEMAFPIDFKKEPLPFPEKVFSLPPVNFKIVFEPNPNKCSIYWAEKMIVFDTRFLEAPLPQLFFIYYHELGHSKYGYGTRYTTKQSEAYCDLYASNKMLDIGYNPSQIRNAPKESLSHFQDYRKEFIEDTLLKNAFK